MRWIPLRVGLRSLHPLACDVPSNEALLRTAWVLVQANEYEVAFNVGSKDTGPKLWVVHAARWTSGRDTQASLFCGIIASLCDAGERKTFELQDPL